MKREGIYVLGVLVCFWFFGGEASGSHMFPFTKDGKPVIIGPELPLAELAEFEEKDREAIEEYFRGLEILARANGDASNILFFLRGNGITPHKIDLVRAGKVRNITQFLEGNQLFVLSTSYFEKELGLTLKPNIWIYYSYLLRIIFLRSDIKISLVFKGLLLLHEGQHAYDDIFWKKSFVAESEVEREAEAWLVVMKAADDYTGNKLFSRCDEAIAKTTEKEGKIYVELDHRKLDSLFPSSLSVFENSVRQDFYNETCKLTHYLKLHGPRGRILWKNKLMEGRN